MGTINGWLAKLHKPLRMGAKSSLLFPSLAGRIILSVHGADETFYRLPLDSPRCAMATKYFSGLDGAVAVVKEESEVRWKGSPTSGICRTPEKSPPASLCNTPCPSRDRESRRLTLDKRVVRWSYFVCLADLVAKASPALPYVRHEVGHAFPELAALRIGR